MARFGVAGLPGLLNLLKCQPQAALEALSYIVSPRVAPVMADAFARLKQSRTVAEQWLRQYPEASAIGLIPDAVGHSSQPHQSALTALRFLDCIGHAETIRLVATRYGREVETALTAALSDPLHLFPTPLPQMPDFWHIEQLPRPLLAGHTRALPLSAVKHLGTMLTFSPMHAPYAGLQQVKEVCDRDSLGTFAWSLFTAWQLAGCPSKEQWAFVALGHLGGDQQVRQLMPIMRSWPGQGGTARAVLSVDVLAMIGTDVAMLHLHSLAPQVKYRSLQAKACHKLEAIARARNLTTEELVDRLVPDLGLDANGTRLLDFSPRQFYISFDEQLRPYILDTAGKRLKTLPKPTRMDDADRAAQATSVWKTLQKDVKKLAMGQIARLELTMCNQRRWPAGLFRQLFAGHPLLIHLVRRLVWGLYDADGTLQSTFRVPEDRSTLTCVIRPANCRTMPPLASRTLCNCRVMIAPSGGAASATMGWHNRFDSSTVRCFDYSQPARPATAEDLPLFPQVRDFRELYRQHTKAVETRCAQSAAAPRPVDNSLMGLAAAIDEFLARMTS